MANFRFSCKRHGAFTQYIPEHLVGVQWVGLTPHCPKCWSKNVKLADDSDPLQNQPFTRNDLDWLKAQGIIISSHL